MTKAKLARLLYAYGDARFGDEWYPIDARAWIGEEAAENLARQMREGLPDPAEAVRLLNLYGESKFANKWRPHLAAEELGGPEGVDLSCLVASEPAPSVGAF